MSEEDRPIRHASGHSVAWRVAVVYAIFGVLWILFSDLVTDRIAGSEEAESRIQLLKEWFFVLATAFLLYWLIRGGTVRLQSAEAARAASELQCRRLLEQLPYGVLVEQDGKITYANPKMTAMLATEESKLLGRNSLDLVHTDSREAASARRQMLRERHPLPTQEIRLLRDDGQTLWVETTAVPFELQGRPASQAIMRDISGRIRAREIQARLEGERAELLERLQMILEYMPIACMLLDRDLRFTFWNSAAERIFGYRFDEVRGRVLAETIIDAGGQSCIHEVVSTVRESDRPVSTIADALTRDGQSVRCSWIATALHGKSGELIGVVAMAQDLTEAQRAQESVRKSEATLAKAQTIAHVGSWELELNSGSVEWSDEMYRIFGIDKTAAPLQREMIHAYLHPDDRDTVIEAADQAINNDAVLDIDHRIVRPDGTLRHVNSQARVLRDASGAPLRLIGTMLDITERKFAEEQLRQLNETLEQRVSDRTAELRAALEDLRAFSYTVSHDLRAPLRTVQRFAKSLIDKDPSDSESGEYVRRIIAMTARMDRLTEEILEYSQLSREELTFTRVSSVLVMHEVIGRLQRDPTFGKASINIREPLPWVLGHRATLATIFFNLLTNAMKFVSPDKQPLVSVWSENRDGMARIWIEDNGIGIAQEDQARIFDPAHRSESDETGGTGGLGLAIVRRGAERMGGRVGFESEPGRGSRFWVELPIDSDGSR